MTFFLSLKLDQVIPDYSSDTSSTPFILKHVDQEHSNAKHDSETPGYMISYSVDPANLKFGEKRMFMHYLANHAMFIDVWDGESLHLIGTATMQMKDLLRHGKEAVQSTFELDIIKTEYDDHSRLNTNETVTNTYFMIYRKPSFSVSGAIARIFTVQDFFKRGYFQNQAVKEN
jgi:hypothetical protein